MHDIIQAQREDVMEKKTIIIAVAAFTVGLAAFAGYSKVSSPGTYEECVMNNIKDAQNDKAALLVNAACRRMFPDPPNYFDKYDKKD